MSIWDKKEAKREKDDGAQSKVRSMICLSLGIVASAILLILCFVDLGLEEPPKLILFLGRFHPVILHMPIGMLSAVIMLEFIALLPNQKKIRSTSHLVLWMAAVTGFVAAVFGDFWALEDGASESLNEHQRMGTIAAVLIIALVGISKLRLGENKRLPNFIYVFLLLFTMAWMSNAAHHGANLTHGETHLTKHETEFIRSTRLWIEGLLGGEEGGHDHDHQHGHDQNEHGGESHDQENTGKSGRSENDTEPVAVKEAYYKQHIHPIMMEYCVDCHGPKKAKGKVRLDSYAYTMKKSVIAGEPDESDLIYLMELPMSDDERMPPPDEKQPPKGTVEFLRAWIESGSNEDSGPDPKSLGL